MAVDTLALVATALAEASPGGVPGDQVPALLRAALVLAGLEASSSLSSRGRRRQTRQVRDPVYRSPLGRAPACLHHRLQQTFRRSQRQSAHPPWPSLRPGMAEGENEPLPEAASSLPSSPTNPGATTIAVLIRVAPAATASGPTAPAASATAVTSNSVNVAAFPTVAAAAAASSPGVPCSSTTSPGAAIPSRPTNSSRCCSCSCDSSPCQVARNARGDVLDAAVIRAPGAALGPGHGAMMRLAEFAQGAPLGLVSTAASVLCWMDGRLC
ncbi:unnamed protein product [Closterium sp. NIES-65]|nr:unnamed protein product [Closterium sp. NIES-65]